MPLSKRFYMTYIPPPLPEEEGFLCIQCTTYVVFSVTLKLQYIRYICQLRYLTKPIMYLLVERLMYEAKQEAQFCSPQKQYSHPQMEHRRQDQAEKINGDGLVPSESVVQFLHCYCTENLVFRFYFRKHWFQLNWCSFPKMCF